MYTRFYGLREKPFSLTPDPRFLFLSEAHREALAHLLYGIEEGQGFIAVTGEVGTGKTTLCRTLLRRLDPGMEVAFIFHPQLSGLELLQAINSELGLPSQSSSRRDLLDSLHEFLLAKKREDRRVLLIVDEAQTLERDALEQLRLVSNLETETEKLIHIVLLGQPELDDVLARSEHRQLRQRITVRWGLGSLTPPETRAYVVHRLRVAAGARREIFTPAGLREIHRLSGGVPRLINAICDRALLAGYAKDEQQIGPERVREAHRELRAEAPASESGAWLRPKLAFAAAAVALVAATAVLTWLGLELLGREPAPPAPAEATPPSLAPPVAARPAPLPVEAAPPIEEPALGEPAALEEVASVDTPPPVNAAPRELEPPASFRFQVARSSPGATAAGSLDALLVAWGRQPVSADLLSLGEVTQSLARAGLRSLHLRSTNLPALAGLDQPALLVLEAMDGAPRYAALTGVSGERVRVAGVGETAEIDADELEGLWTGEAYVPWRDFESLPGMIVPGARGDSVTWLQESLAALGLYSGAPSGRYDATTLTAVRALQQVSRQRVDGKVGPITKIRLYQMVGGYDVPRLAEAPARSAAGSGGASS